MEVRLSRAEVHRSLMLGNDTVFLCRKLGLAPRAEVMGNKGREEQTITGFKTEFAVAKAFGLDPPVMSILSDYGVDLWWNDISVDVKSSSTGFLIFDTLNHFKADIAIHTELVDNNTVKIFGWIEREKFIAESWDQDFGYGPRKVLTPDKLRPTETINEDLGFPKSANALNQSTQTS